MAQFAKESDMVVDKLENWRKYSSFSRLTKAFELLTSPAAATWPDGRVELVGKEIVAMPQGYATRPAEQCRFEAHRKYLDIQAILSGAEKMGYAPITSLAETEPYNAEKDVAFYAGNGDVLTVRAGMFTIFYPQDGHMPCVQAGERPAQVRKIVMKVMVD
jgi:YhcH/YjgK/YiaL family protein